MTVREANLTPASSADREPELIESGGTARLHLTLATTDYDHVRDLVNGVIRPEGITLTAFVLPVEEVFYRFIKNREWDISEMSFGKYIGFASQGNSPFVGIPVFPSRVFRHSAFYVRADRGIGTPKDLGQVHLHTVPERRPPGKGQAACSTGALVLPVAAREEAEQRENQNDDEDDPKNAQ